MHGVISYLITTFTICQSIFHLEKVTDVLQFIIFLLQKYCLWIVLHAYHWQKCLQQIFHWFFNLLLLVWAKWPTKLNAIYQKKEKKSLGINNFYYMAASDLLSFEKGIGSKTQMVLDKWTESRTGNIAMSKSNNNNNNNNWIFFYVSDTLLSPVEDIQYSRLEIKWLCFAFSHHCHLFRYNNIVLYQSFLSFKSLSLMLF